MTTFYRQTSQATVNYLTKKKKLVAISELDQSTLDLHITVLGFMDITERNVLTTEQLKDVANAYKVFKQALDTIFAG